MNDVVEKTADAVSMEQVIPCLHEASNPYWDWFWNSRNIGETQLRERLTRASSELYCERIVCLKKAGEILGGFLALPGHELNACRKADLLCLLKQLKNQPDPAFNTRIRLVANLFSAVADDEFYLSRIGVAVSARGLGLGKRLLELYLERGRKNNFAKFRLDVSKDNERAIALYRGHGFSVAGESVIPGTPIAYCSMIRTF